MTTPFTLGVASGATLFNAIGIILGITAIYLPIFSFIGAIFTIIILFSVTSKLKNYETSSLLLVGIALSFFYSASLMVLFYISDLQESYEIIKFTMGSLDIVGFNEVILMTIVSILVLLIIMKYRYEIKLLLVSSEFTYLFSVPIGMCSLDVFS